jgi:hypothetical protein
MNKNANFFCFLVSMSVIETADNIRPRTLGQGKLTTDSESLDDLHPFTLGPPSLRFLLGQHSVRSTL